MIDYVRRLAGPYTQVGQKTFPFSFKIFETKDIYVAFIESESAEERLLVGGTDYIVTMNPNQDSTPGGSVTLMNPLTEGQRLSIGSAIPYTQTMQLTNFNRFPPEVLNTEADREVVMIQQLAEQLDRAITTDATDTMTPKELKKNLLDTAAKANEYAQKSEKLYQESEKLHQASVALRDEFKGIVDGAGDKIVSEGHKQITRITQTGDSLNNTVIAVGQKWKKEVGALASDLLSKTTQQATAAGESAAAAAASAKTAKASETAAASAKALVEASISTATEKANAAVTSASMAAASQAAANISEKNAKASETSASSSKTAAAASAAAAKASEDKAAEYANQASSGQIQADWAETDTTSKGYIKRKPDVRQVTIKKDVSTTGAEYRVTYRQTTADGDSTSYLVASPKLTFNPVTGVLAATGFKGALAGNASTATKLATPRNIKLTGGASGTAVFDGSANVTFDVTVSKVGTADIGEATVPIYLKAGVPVAGTPLANVATSGSYSDLSDTPTIPDTSGLIPKIGNAGYLKCYEEAAVTRQGAVTINLNSAATTVINLEKAGAVTITLQGGEINKAATKLLYLWNTTSVTFNTTTGVSLTWMNGNAPTFKASNIVVLTFIDTSLIYASLVFAV